jgi:hypothetical protein
LQLCHRAISRSELHLGAPRVKAQAPAKFILPSVRVLLVRSADFTLPSFEASNGPPRDRAERARTVAHDERANVTSGLRFSRGPEGKFCAVILGCIVVPTAYLIDKFVSSSGCKCLAGADRGPHPKYGSAQGAMSEAQRAVDLSYVWGLPRCDFSSILTLLVAVSCDCRYQTFTVYAVTCTSDGSTRRPSSRNLPHEALHPLTHDLHPNPLTKCCSKNRGIPVKIG